MTSDERFRQVREKLERAEQHIRDLDIAVEAFLQTRPYIVLSEHDPQTLQRKFYVESVADVPPPIVCIAGDAIHNLRSTLDHLIWQLVLANGNTPNFRTSFPIFEDAKQYRAESPRKVEGVRKEAIEVIDGIKPYKTGRLNLWWLHQLDIIDKHRVLFAAGIEVSGHTPLPSLREKLTKGFKGSRPNDPVPDFTKMFVRPSTPISVMKTGDVILSVPEAEAEQNMNFLFSVSLNEPEVIEPQPMIHTIKMLANLVTRIISAFSPYL